VAIVAAALEALFDPSLRALIPALVPDPNFAQATNALMDATLRIAFVVGPAIVAVLGRVMPTIHFFTLDAATFALSALSIWAVQSGSAPEVSGLRLNSAESAMQSITAAIRVIRAYPILRFEMIGTAIVWGLWNLCFTLGLALLIRQRFFGGVGAYALAVSAYGTGNVIRERTVGDWLERRGDLPLWHGGYRSFLLGADAAPGRSRQTERAVMGTLSSILRLTSSLDGSLQYGKADQRSPALVSRTVTSGAQKYEVIGGQVGWLRDAGVCD
jgi:hypothetical protein